MIIKFKFEVKMIKSPPFRKQLCLVDLTMAAEFQVTRQILALVDMVYKSVHPFQQLL